MARPTKCTPKTRQVIVDALKAGLYRETAAQLAGIGVSTLYSWIERGEADIEASKRTVYAEFVEALQRGEAEGEADLLATIRESAPKNWQAAAWMLERKMPEKYGRRDQVKLEHSGRIGHDLEGLTDEQLDKVAQGLEALP